MKIGQKGISTVAIVVIAVAVVVVLVLGAISAVILLKLGKGPALGGPTTPTTTEEGYLGDVEPYVKKEGLTEVWGHWYITVYRTIGNRGEAGVVTVTCRQTLRTQTKYIYLDKGKEKRISFQISDGWRGRPGPYVTPYYKVTASPTPAVYIQGKPGQDYIPELSNIEVDISKRLERFKVDVLFYDDKGRILAFEGIPVDVTVKVYTEKLEDYVDPQGRNCSRYVKDRQIYEKTVTIDSYKDASSRLGGEKIEIPFDVYDLKEVGFVEVIVHTSKGDFKDEVRV